MGSARKDCGHSLSGGGSNGHCTSDQQGVSSGARDRVPPRRPTVDEMIDAVMASDHRETREARSEIVLKDVPVPTHDDLEQLLAAIVRHMSAHDREQAERWPGRLDRLPWSLPSALDRAMVSYGEFQRELPRLALAAVAHAIEQSRESVRADVERDRLQDRVRELECEVMELKHDAQVAASMVGRC